MITIETAIVRSPVGDLALYARDGALCGLAFADHDERLRAQLQARFGDDVEYVRVKDPAGAATRVRRYLAGELDALDDIAVDLGGTPFQARVWAALRKIPVGATYRLMRRFHRPASGVMVATGSMERELAGRGFRNLRRWSRGVDTTLFRPGDKHLLDLPRPINLYVGRVAVEKNIEDFLKLDLAGSKLVVGDGPQLPDLRRKYPETRFVGAKVGEELAAHYAAADLFVFPSRTDTFGLVLLEALASGLPVAAYPVPGPLDIIDGTGVGVLDEDLAAAARRAITISPERCRAVALQYSWRASAEQFVHNLQPFC